MPTPSIGTRYLRHRSDILSNYVYEGDTMATAVQAHSSPPYQAVLPATRSNGRAYWILFVPLVFYSARGLFSFQSAGDVTGGFTPGVVQVREPGILGSIVIPGLAYAIVFWMMKSQWRQVLSLAKRFKTLSLLAVLAFVSTVWSQDPSHSAVVGGCYCVDTLFAFWLVARFDTEELMTVLERLLLVVCVLSLLMVMFFPKFGLSQLDVRNPNAWAGIFSSRGATARPLLYLIVPSFLLWRKHATLGRGITLLLGLWIVYKAHVVTTDLLMALFMGYLIVQYFNRRLGPRSSLALLAAVFGGGLVISLLGIALLPTILQALGRDPTLTGRTEIWSVLVDSVMKRPFLGYGYYAFWQGLKGESGIAIHRLNWTFGYAHNGYLEITLQLGLLGLAVFLVSLFQAIRNSWTCLRLDRTSGSDWYVGIILLVIVSNLDDCTVLWPRDLVSILYIVAYCGVSLNARRLRRSRYLGVAAYN
jgi:exopolysaccharide production protein ExoQ